MEDKGGQLLSFERYFNSTKVQFGEYDISGGRLGGVISIPLRYNLEAHTAIEVPCASTYFNSTKVQFGVGGDLEDRRCCEFQFH